LRGIKELIEMSIGEFFSQYREEKECRQFFKRKREARGLECERCGSLNFYWIEKESRWKCKGCGKPIGLRKGTVMENSNLGYRVWLWGLYLMCVTKKGFSAMEVQRLIGHKRYEPIWLMLHKIRISMGNRDDGYLLDGYIEKDEGFFEGHRKKDAEGNPAKELDRQVKAVVAVSTEAVAADKQKPYGKATKCGYVKIKTVSSLNKKEVSCEAKGMLSKSATVITDGRRCYNGLKDIVAVHQKIVVEDKKEVSKVFPWVHIVISNVKKKLSGLHHHVKDEYMQNYLSEFCYKFNRRYFGQALFDRLLVAALQRPWYASFPNYG
jgi:hypothetical protein